MSEPIDNSEPAFPVPGQGKWEDPTTCKQWTDFNGMSLRDWFAGQALNGYLASWNDDTDQNFFEPHHVAKTSYAFADAMLSARKGGAE